MSIRTWTAALLTAMVVAAWAAPSHAGWYENAKFGYRIQFPDAWAVAEETARDAVRARKPDGSIELAIQALDLNGQVASAEVLEGLFTTRVFNNFRLLQKAPDTVNGIPGMAAAYGGQDGARQVIVGAFYIVQGGKGFVLYSVVDAGRIRVLAPESDAVFNTFAIGAPPPAGGGLLSGIIGNVGATGDPCAQVVGKWRWFTGSIQEFRADGTLNGDPNHSWKCTDPARRIITVVWSKGKWVDTLVLSADGKSLEGKNQRGDRVWGKR